MKLGVSNLAWRRDEEEFALAVLQEQGASGVEVAPTRLGDWSELTPKVLADYRGRCASFGLSIPSLQAIFFNRPDAQLLGTENDFARLQEHMKVVGSICNSLGSKIAVFGSPQNRRRGDMPLEQAIALGLDRMRRLGDVAAASDFIIGIEPVPIYYKCDFLNRIDDLSSFVTACDHPHVMIHMDTACVSLAGDNPARKIRELEGRFAHFHVSEPDLGDFTNPKCAHAAIGTALWQTSYEGWIVIEMRESHSNSIPRIRQALLEVDSAYFERCQISKVIE